MKSGDRVQVQGYTDELWITDYHTRVSSYGTIVTTPNARDKKVLVCLDQIDGEMHVNVAVRKSKVYMI